MITSVCVSICPPAYLWKCTEVFFVLAIPSRGSVILRRRCDTLFASGFTDYVVFAHNGYTNGQRGKESDSTAALRISHRGV